VPEEVSEGQEEEDKLKKVRELQRE